MKYILALTLSLLTSSVVSAGEPSCDITDYGIVGEKPKSEVKVSDVSYAIGSKNQIYGQIEFKETTTKIPASLGLRFGLKHVFSNIPKDEFLKTVIIHPPMLSPSGEYKTISSGPERPAANGTSYKFESDEELLSGKWIFQFEYQNVVLCRKEFTVYLQP